MDSFDEQVRSTLVGSRLSQFPAPAQRSDYTEVKRELLERWGRLPSPPRSIYQIGQVSVPGLSDLDFVLVFNRGQTVDWSLLDPGRYDDKIRSLYQHRPICCTSRSWRTIEAIFPIFDVNHLYGDQITKEGISDENRTGCALSLLLNMLITKLPLDILQLLKGEVVEVKTLLAANKSIKYTLRLAEEAGIEVSSEGWTTAENANLLREEWFDLEKEEQVDRLARVTANVLRVTGKIMEKTSSLVENSFGPCRKNVDGGELLSFRTAYDYESLFLSALRAETSEENVRFPKPSSFLSVLGVYASATNGFGEYLRSKSCAVCSDAERSSELSPGVRYHAQAVERHVSELARLGVYPQKYIGFGYSKTKKLDKVIRYSREIKRGNISFKSFLSKISGKIL